MDLCFAGHSFLKTLIKTFGFDQETLILKKNNQIQAVLPLLSMKGELGSVYNSLPFFGSYGGARFDNFRGIVVVVWLVRLHKI